MTSAWFDRLGGFLRSVRHGAEISTVLALSIMVGTVDAQQGAPTLTITSPTNGAQVQWGQSLGVSVSVSQGATFSSIQVIVQGIGLSTALTSPPYSFTVTVPSQAAGQESITAVGVTANGSVVFSPAITVDAEPSLAVSGITLNFSQVNFGFTGDQVGLTVQGTLSDGSLVNLTQSNKTTFSSGNIAVATVSSTGLLTAVGPGSTTITVANGGQIAVGTVSVPNSLRGDLNADGKIDSDDVNILLAALNTNATGTFDARDLNGDGVIDMKDVQALAALCTLPGCSTSSTVASTPRLVLSPVALPFANQLVGTSSQSQTITAVNSGAAALTIQSIAASGDFSETNTCSAALNPETSCAINIVFGPTAAGLRSSSLTIKDNSAGSPHVVGLSGTGTQLAVPAVTVTPSPSSITTAQVLSVSVSVNGGTGNPTPTGTVALTSGSYISAAATLNGGSVTINISANSLAVGTDTLTVNYTPDAASSSVYSSASGTASVSVTSPSFALTSTAVTVTPGATTGNTSTITVTPAGGFTGSVALTAAITSSPSGTQYPPTLSFGSTSPVSITGTSAGAATLTVSTTAPSSASLVLPKHSGVPWYASSGAALACLLLFSIPARRRSWRTILGMLAIFVALTGGVLACGGKGGGGGGGTSNPGTTAGTYTVTVTAVSGNLTQTTTVTVTVN